MEPDDELYTPFLEPLLSRPNTTLVPKTGIIWKDLNDVLCPKYLPHQTERPRDETPTRNDTLLVTANLSFYPKKSFRGFDSVADLVLYQFISAIRTSSIFQKYGLVRILIWTGDDEKLAILPRSVQRRKRSAIEAEISTEWITEIAGAEPDDQQVWFVRDRAIDLESAQNVADKMAKSGLKIPPGRETNLLKDLRSRGKDAPTTAGKQAAVFERPYVNELRALEEESSTKGFASGTPKDERLRYLRYLLRWNSKRNNVIMDLLKEREAIAKLKPRAAAERKEKQTREAAWNDKVNELNKDLQLQFLLARDNLHIFQQDPPVLNWDRRAMEPLVVKNTEFFPNVPSALLDIQPKPMHPLIRATGPGTSHSGDVFELVLRSLLQASKSPVSKVLESLAPGASEGVFPNCPALQDPARGGSRLGGHAEVSPRALNEQQLIEILEAWMAWPFAPSYAELVGRTVDDPGDQGADEEGNKLGQGDF
jgi:transcription factor 1